MDGHAISWNLRYRSTFRVTLSNKGWIGFSRTPHSDALFSGQITLDGRSFAGILWGWSAGTQLRIPASQLLDVDPCLFSPPRQSFECMGSEHIGSLGL